MKFYLYTLAMALGLSACGSETGSDRLSEHDHHHEAGSAEVSAPENIKPYAFSSGVKVLGVSKPEGEVEEKMAAVTPPKGMVYVPGGYTQIGSAEGMAQEQPVFWVQIKPFFIDEHPVTVGDFRKFVAATGYITQAEKFGNAGMIDESTGKQWILKDGANWRYPQGPDFPPAPDDHPVTQVSWNDAQAYCKWANKRLPTEFEWEHAARNARNDRTMYPWGNDIDKAGKYNANIWQGKFPEHNYVTDGFKFTSPVGKFGKTPLGLTDMSGNVWEWCENWKQEYRDVLTQTKPEINEKTERAQRGGSFLCEPGWCHGYRVSGRSSSTPETSLMHVGFRCVKDV